LLPGRYSPRLLELPVLTDGLELPFSIGKVGPQIERRLELLFSLKVAPAFRQRPAQLIMRNLIIGTKRQPLAIKRDGLIASACYLGLLEIIAESAVTVLLLLILQLLASQHCLEILTLLGDFQLLLLYLLGLLLEHFGITGRHHCRENSD
jgi:hypothetical protein